MLQDLCRTPLAPAEYEIMKEKYQVPDDPALLSRMMEDMKNADQLYGPTCYWSRYEKFFLPQLKKRGLKDFRSRVETHNILASLGGHDNLIQILFYCTLRFSSHRLNRLTQLIFRAFRKAAHIDAQINPPESEMALYFFEHVLRKFNDIEEDLFKCPADRYGNPDNVVTVNGTLWTLQHLQYCSLYADFAKYIPRTPDMVMCELGTGMGRHIEIMARLYERATFLMFDIPPQLYVANQYLMTVLGDRVVPYEKAVRIEPGIGTDLPEEVKGKIVVLPSWKMPEWSGCRTDIFCNISSFPEMEPDVVANYLELVKRMQPEHIYISARPEGNCQGEWRPGMGGTKAPVTEKCYFDSLDGEYELVTTYPTDYFLRKTGHMSYIFRKKTHKIFA